MSKALDWLANQIFECFCLLIFLALAALAFYAFVLVFPFLLIGGVLLLPWAIWRRFR